MKKGIIILGEDGLANSVFSILEAAKISEEIYFVEEDKVFTYTMLKGCNCEPEIIIVDPITTEENLARAFAMTRTNKLWVEPIQDGGYYIEPFFILVLGREISKKMLVNAFGRNVTYDFDVFEI